MKLFVLMLPLSLAIFAAPAFAAGAATTGTPAVVLKLCMNCHNVDGNSDSQMIPRLASQRPDYIERQLFAYREQTRSNPAARHYMWGMAHMLSDQEIKQAATWFSAQKIKIPDSIVVNDLYRSGDAIFHHGIPDKGVPACEICHGQHGEGGPIAPRIADQHANYLATQLKVMATDERPAATAMQGFAKHLSQANIDSLVAYVSKIR